MTYDKGLKLTARRLFGKLYCTCLCKDSTAFILRSLVSIAVATAILAAMGCAVRRTTKIAPPELSAPPVEASLDDLVARVNALDSGVQTLTATVDFQPTAGSVYSGVIKEYQDVKGFILVKKPAMIRVIGQAPVIRTNIFDMVSDGETFRLSIPPKHKFIVGPTALTRPSKNALENMRPQHILDAMLVPPIDTTKDRISDEEAEENSHRYYVLTVFQPGDGAELFPLRKVWFDRSNLDVARMQTYGPKGRYTEEVQYSSYKDFQGTRYPAQIQITRPVEDYRLAITIQKATFNQEITPDKFELKKPESSELVELSSVARPEVENGK
jgi:outer membrane lipoprotein-sorting protein